MSFLIERVTVLPQIMTRQDSLRYRKDKIFLLVVAGFLVFQSVARAAPPVLDLDRYRGKVVYLDFWASWCQPCRQSFPWMNSMQGKYGDKGLVVIAVNVDADRKDADRFLQAVPADFQVVYDSDGDLAQQYHLVGMPSSFIIGPDGRVAFHHEGFTKNSPRAYEAEIQGLITR